jgi:hypothetical protein
MKRDEAEQIRKGDVLTVRLIAMRGGLDRDKATSATPTLRRATRHE